MSKKLFVSLPMRDRSIDEIRANMDYICELVSEEFQIEFELIDTVWMNEPTTDIHDEGMWYLGKSLQALAEADLVAFDEDWKMARGCIIEHMACAMYGIPYVDLAMSYTLFEEPVNDYTHDWDVAGAVNAELSQQVAKAEGIVDDFEDALGFEPEDGKVLHTDINYVETGRNSVRDILRKKRDERRKRKKDQPDIEKSESDEEDEDEKVEHADISDELEPGEYDADVR